MKFKIKSINSLIRIIIGIYILLIALVALGNFLSEAPIMSAPECQAHVKVVDKRTEEEWFNGSPDETSYMTRSYFATFEFPDGSKKEFAINAAATDEIWLWSTGTITYKETAEIGRRIISFEKDPEYGGTKVMIYTLSHTIILFLIDAGAITFVAGFIIIWLKLMSR